MRIYLLIGTFQVCAGEDKVIRVLLSIFLNYVYLNKMVRIKQVVSIVDKQNIYLD